MIFDGKAFAAKRREKLLKERKGLGDVSLGIVVSSQDPVTSSFVRIKEKNAEALQVRLVRYEVSEGAGAAQVREVIDAASKEGGVIVQLPIPNVDARDVLDAIPEEKDVDALSPKLVQRLEGGDLSVIPPVAAAVREIIHEHNLEVAGKKVVVVGKGRLVGSPCAALFSHLGSKVVVLDKHDDVTLHTKEADIVVLGAGSPHVLKASMVKEGAVVFDAGTSEQAGVVVGDADPLVAEKASFFTPVPGGIGPVTVVEIFGNLFTLTRKEGR